MKYKEIVKSMDVNHLCNVENELIFFYGRLTLCWDVTKNESKTFSTEQMCYYAWLFLKTISYIPFTLILKFKFIKLGGFNSYQSQVVLAIIVPQLFAF